MDSLTQIVLGAAVGEAVLGKKIGNRAMLWGAVAGTIPDLDVVWRYLTDTITATELHRGFSHSVVFSILVAPLFGWLVHQLKKRSDVGWKGWTKLFFWGLFTHPLLDAFTTWGTQLFWPFNWRVAFNSIFVIDPLYTFPFSICVLIAATKTRGSLSRKRVNNLGIYMSTVYLLLTVVVKYVVHQKVVDNLEQQDIAYTQISTRPAPMNIILWNINVDAGSDYLIGDYSLFDTKPISFKAYDKKRLEGRELINTPEVQRLIAISEGWYILEKNQNSWFYNDLRFGLIAIDPENPQFVFRYKLVENRETITVTEDRPDTSNMDAVLGNLWNRIQGN